MKEDLTLEGEESKTYENTRLMGKHTIRNTQTVLPLDTASSRSSKGHSSRGVQWTRAMHAC